MKSDNPQLRRAEEILAKKGKSFHWAKKLLSEKHGERATRLYAFCRYLDDLADEATSPAQARAALMEVSQSLQTGRTQDPVVADAINLMSDCRIEPQIPQELINGLLTDLDEVGLKTVDELLRYCYRVAGTVGLMMSDVLDVKDPAASPFAIDLGIGMQLTNICRDVQEDARMGRRYIPNEIIGKISLDDLINPPEAQEERLSFCIQFLLNLADEYYESGESGLPYLPLRARHGILIASRVYHAIGLKLESRDYRYWEGRVVIPKTRKLGITFMALGGSLVDSRFWTKPLRHRPELHRALQALPRVDTRYGI